MGVPLDRMWLDSIREIELVLENGYSAIIAMSTFRSRADLYPAYM